MPLDTSQIEIVDNWLEYFRNQEMGFSTTPPSDKQEDIDLWTNWYKALPKSSKPMPSPTPTPQPAPPITPTTEMPTQTVTSIPEQKVEKPKKKFVPFYLRGKKKKKRRSSSGLTTFISDF